MRPLLFYEPHARDKSILPHDPFKALIAPRPISWVTTISKAGEVNLARFIENGIVDAARMRLIAHCGYMNYAVADKLFVLERPKKA